MKVAQPGRHTLRVREVWYHGTPVTKGAVIKLRKATPHLSDRDCIRFEFEHGFGVKLRLTHRSIQQGGLLRRSYVSVNWTFEEEDEAGRYSIYLEVADDDPVKVLEFQLEVTTSNVRARPTRSGGLLGLYPRKRRGSSLALRQKYHCQLSKLTYSLADTSLKGVEILMYATAAGRPREVYLASEQGTAGKWYARDALKRVVEDMYSAK